MMGTHQGKAKIVATLGPSSNSVDMIVRMIEKGVDVIRLNFSHGTHEDHGRAIHSVREAVSKTGVHLGIMQDLGGPKIRIGALATQSVELVEGRTVVLTTQSVEGTASRISTTYDKLPEDVQTGNVILLDDGKIRLTVTGVKGGDVECEVAIGGTLLPHKGINLPGVAVSAPSLTEKDLRDLEFGIRSGVDFVALSFVRSGGDVQELRKAIADCKADGVTPSVVAKIEKPQAISSLNDIINEADAIMVARGDLGVELPPEDVPLLQKMIIKRCNESGKPVIVATQMLESMINSPTPTRAEASDVANAVVDGVDAVMLSGETSVGRYPLEAIEMMERIIRKVESERVHSVRLLDQAQSTVEDQKDALGQSACVLAEQMNAAAIVAVTNTGQTAGIVARYRPRPGIIAITDNVSVLRRLRLVWGIHGVLLEKLSDNSDQALRNIRDRLVEEGLVAPGQYVILLAGQPFFARGSTNFIKVEKIS